jgi:release factor glutamine methyltransferase
MTVLTPSQTAALVVRLRAAGCVFAEEEAALLVAEAGTAAELEALVARRVAGAPLEQVLGWVEFCGLRIRLEPGVFVPRRRTELMVAEAIRRAGRPAGRPVLVDLCCGSGAVGLAVLDRLGRGELHACDVDPVAVRCARDNLGDRGQVHEGDLDMPLPERLHGVVDVLTANVPYVPSDEIALMPPEARDHEARVALDGGADGLAVLARVAGTASRWLAPGGCLLVEVGERQVPAATALLERGGLRAEVVRDDDLAATVLVGTSPA